MPISSVSALSLKANVAVGPWFTMFQLSMETEKSTEEKSFYLF